MSRSLSLPVRVPVAPTLPSPASSAPGVTVVEASKDAKLSAPGSRGMSATYVSQASCPSSCPLRAAGCYAEVGRVAFTTNRLNGSRADRRTLARREAAGIRALTGDRRLRVHVVGDCSTSSAAGIVGAAMAAHERKQGQRAWTYTHAWQSIARKAWRGARVAASVHTVADVRKAWRRGYGVAIAVLSHPAGRKAYTLADGVTVIPCPAQFIDPRTGTRSTTCERCQICSSLTPGGPVVGFSQDYGTKLPASLTQKG